MYKYNKHSTRAGGMADDAVAFAAAKSQRRQRRRCTGATGGGGGGDMMLALPEHVLQEILSHLSTIKDLFKLAATCGRWLARFTDRRFLHELLCPAARHDGGLLGFFLHDAFFLPAAPGALSPLLGLHAAGTTMARALTPSLLTDGDDGAFDLDFDYAAVPLVARRGILIMQLVPRRLDTFAAHTHLLLGVCNPVTGQSHLLPPLDTNPNDICCYAIITAADAADANNAAGAGGRYMSSRLLVAAVEVSTSDWAVHVHSYSATTRSWSAPATICINLIDGCSFSLVGGQRSAVVHHGAAHWLWRRRDDDGSLYKLSVPLGGAAAGAGCVCFASFTRIPTVVGGGGSNPPLLDVAGDDEGNLAAAVPYEMDLVDFFRHQLAGGLRAAGSSGYLSCHAAWQ